MSAVRTAYRRARDTVSDTAFDHIVRGLREDVVRWAMLADSPDRFERQNTPARAEARGSV
jgi:hypothetical protein